MAMAPTIRSGRTPQAGSSRWKGYLASVRKGKIGRMRKALGLVCVLLAACGAPTDPAISSCRTACTKENGCAGAKQQNCSGLCDARPSKCLQEYADYWTCAEAHPSEACSSYKSCSTAFATLSTCIVAFCFAYPLDSACFYKR